MKHHAARRIVDFNVERPTRSPKRRQPKLPEVAIVGIRCLRCKAYRTSDVHPCECGYFGCVRVLPVREKREG
ncbi:hypothetical protein LCGC14_1604650 [marine sediment metagenome]|uniref:Uncharacterized protein n=1 Tax=marine sediment metagenome TaxID=412755 RepID=A0A0F9LA44_9ZZZZ